METLIINSPANVIPGQTYEVTLTVKNNSKKAGVSAPAILTVGISAEVGSTTLIPTQETPYVFGTDETGVIRYNMVVPSSAFGTGFISAWVDDPNGNTLASDQTTLIVERISGFDLDDIVIQKVNRVAFSETEVDSDGLKYAVLEQPISISSLKDLSLSFIWVGDSLLAEYGENKGLLFFLRWEQPISYQIEKGDFEYNIYTSRYHGLSYAGGVTFMAQTFTPLVSHRIKKVKLPLCRWFSPGQVVVTIRATNNGYPTGATLCYGISDGDTLPHATYDNVPMANEWRWIELGDGAWLEAGVQYGIVVAAPYGVGSKETTDPYKKRMVGWMIQEGGVLYPRGCRYESINSGASWGKYEEHDFLFIESGEALGEPLTEEIYVLAPGAPGFRRLYIAPTACFPPGYTCPPGTIKWVSPFSDSLIIDGRWADGEWKAGEYAAQIEWAIGNLSSYSVKGKFRIKNIICTAPGTA